MNSLRSYALCALAGLLTVTSLTAGESRDIPPQQEGKGRSGYMGYRVEHGDTAYFDSIDPAWIFPKGYRGSKRDLRKYYRLVYNFNKVYPYALLAKDMESQVERHNLGEPAQKTQEGSLHQQAAKRIAGCLQATAQEHDHFPREAAHQTG